MLLNVLKIDGQYIFSNVSQVMKLNPSINHHAIIGLLTGLWVFLFGYFIRPFEHGNMNNHTWLVISIGFSIAMASSYILASVFQRIIYQKWSKWNVTLEVATYFLFYTIFSISTYQYYKSDIVNGFYSFYEFFTRITLVISLILTPVLFLARKYTLKLLPQEDEYLTIKGNNKLDFLKLKKGELICISNAQNYVEIFFLEDKQLKTKLIRSSLKKIQHDFDFLVQIHRSHLINPTHFKSWKDSNTILLTQLELPVSKTYKNKVLSL